MTDVKRLLDKWRADADSRPTYDQAVVKTLRYCADELEALLASPADLPPTEAPLDCYIDSPERVYTASVQQACGCYLRTNDGRLWRVPCETHRAPDPPAALPLPPEGE
jgi:hypothetical protein